MDKEKSSSKRSRDDRDHKHHHHRSHRDSDHRRSDHKSRDDREGSRERDRGHDRESKRDREGSRERRERSREREGHRDRGYDKESKRGDGEEKRDKYKHREVKREGSYDETHKRKERGESPEREEKRSRRRFEDGEERRERRRIGDKAYIKEEPDGEHVRGDSDFKVKDEVRDGFHDASTMNGGQVHNGAGEESVKLSTGKASDRFMAPTEPQSAKVSSIPTSNENIGVSVTRSHEVTGNSSTDGSSSAAGKSVANLSFDAIAKAKKALQMQKQTLAMLKLNKGTGSKSGTSTVGTVGSGVPVSAGISSSSLNLPAAAASLKSPLSSVAASNLSAPNIEAVKRAQELAAKMGFTQNLQSPPVINIFPGQVPIEIPVPQKPKKAPVLRVDALGREIDEHGNVVNFTKPSNLSTLKVNINKQKKDAFQIIKPELDVDPESNPHFDERMGINKNKLLRPKRMSFQFVEEGKWSKEAEMMKLKSQFGEAGAKELKAKQAQLAKAKADINPNLIEVSERIITKEKPKDPIPDIEWWDAPLLASGSYGDIAEGGTVEDKLKIEKITIYVEHPLPIEPPAEPAPPPPQPLKLTKKEQKKLRTQRRLAREKDRQEMIRQGLLEPPKPKVKLSNLMKVLGSEATQDPTKLEMEIRSAAAEREQAHVDRNIARKLTPAEKREKKERKLFEDSTLETIVSVYKINDLSEPKARFKVDVNAQENRMTGCAVISEGISVVVVESGSKSIKRYQKLMLRRINWAESVKEDEDEDEDDEKPPNKCVLVWQGSVAKPSFSRFSVHECITEAAARKVFADVGVPHYWDLSVNFSEDQM